MRLSSKGQYALEAMVALATADPDKSLSVRAVSGLTGISEAYLEQIFANLKRDGLVESVRGTQGGYLLSKQSERITISAILEAGEGSIAPVRCVESGKAHCDEYETCLTRFLWADLLMTIRSVTDRITLADILVFWQDKEPDKPEDEGV